jgi:hypothetical protein
MHDAVFFAARRLLEGNNENPIYRSGINAGGGSNGGAAVHALHAQAKPPVYMIAINEVSDPNGYAKEYVPPAQKSVKDHGGKAWRRYEVGAILPNFRLHSRLARNTRNLTSSLSLA